MPHKKDMEFALYGICKLLRYEKIPETHVLATLLTGKAWLFNVKTLLAKQVSTRYFRIFRLQPDPGPQEFTHV